MWKIVKYVYARFNVAQVRAGVRSDARSPVMFWPCKCVCPLASGKSGPLFRFKSRFRCHRNGLTGLGFPASLNHCASASWHQRVTCSKWDKEAGMKCHYWWGLDVVVCVGFLWVLPFPLQSQNMDQSCTAAPRCSLMHNRSFSIPGVKCTEEISLNMWPILVSSSSWTHTNTWIYNYALNWNHEK